MKISKAFQFQDIQGFKLGSNPIGKPSMYSHCYFVDGLLIDTGHSNMKAAALNYLKPLPVEQIFLSHHHEDHTGNLKELQDHFHCPTFASSRCVELMKLPPKISPAQWLIWGNRPPNFNIKAFESSQISTPNYTFDIIPIPGHAEDMVCLHEANQGWLFSSDLWVSTYIKFFMRTESMSQQIESMKRVALLDFDVMLCGHNPQFENGQKLLKQKIQFMEDFYGKAAKFHHQGLSANAILKAMKLKEDWMIRIMSAGDLSTINMIKAVIRDEQTQPYKAEKFQELTQSNA